MLLILAARAQILLPMPGGSFTRLSWDEEYGRRGIPSSYRDGPSGAVVWAFSRGLGGSRGLDVGCGTGRNTLYAAAQGLRMTGFDRSAAAIERARARGGDAAVPRRTT